MPNCAPLVVAVEHKHVRPKQNRMCVCWIWITDRPQDTNLWGQNNICIKLKRNKLLPLSISCKQQKYLTAEEASALCNVCAWIQSYIYQCPVWSSMWSKTAHWIEQNLSSLRGHMLCPKTVKQLRLSKMPLWYPITVQWPVTTEPVHVSNVPDRCFEHSTTIPVFCCHCPNLFETCV